MERAKKKEWFYPTAYCVWGEEERDAIDKVLDSGRLTMGEQVEAFEEDFARYHGMRHAVMVNSGSSANLVAVAAMFHLSERRPLKRGDKVIVPALAWSTTYAPLVQHDLELVLADCNDQWNVGHVHEPGVHMQVVVSILGNPAHFWAEAPWPIIEDNCESLGAVDLKGRKCGTRGLMNTFSLFYSHQIGAIEGGVILTNDEECAWLCRVLRAHGWTRDVVEPKEFHQEYNFYLMGYNVRPQEINAAVARVQLRKLRQFIRQCTANLIIFRHMTAGLPIKFPEDNGTLSPFGMNFEVPRGMRERLVLELRQAGIDCRLPTGGSFNMHPYGDRWRGQETPRANAVHRHGMFLGNGPLPLEEEIGRAAGVMHKVLG